jgi:biopolymer transport protein TolR
MKRERRRRDLPRVDINITNLIDVTLTLLIVFMIVAPLLKQGLEIELPKAKVVEGLDTEEKVILVECDKNGLVHVNQTEVVPGAVEETIRGLRERLGSPPVQLRADQALPFGDVVGIFGAIKAAGVEEIDVESDRLSIGE